MLVLALTLCFASSALAVNDWNVPCFQGTCEYDYPSSSASMSGTVQIRGSPNAIADITPAGGWEIIECSPDSLNQDIRLVCKDGAASECAHLFASTGPEGKIVRLPQSCGSVGFAHISKAWIPDDQAVPPDVTSSISTRGNAQPVRALRLDGNFGSVNNPGLGEMNFTIYGVNIPGVDLSDIDTDRRRSFLDDIADRIQGKLNVNKLIDLPPLNQTGEVSLFNETIACGPIEARVSVESSMEASALVKVGIIASGQIFPPKLDDFRVVSDVTADLSGTLQLTAEATATLDSGRITIFEVGIPGLDFPPFLSIGPKFVVDAQAIATIDGVADLTVGLNYRVDNAPFQFPPGKNDKFGQVKPQDTPLKLSVTPSAKISGSIEGHIIPSLRLGLDAFGVVEAEVFLELDASAKVSLEASASAPPSTLVGRSAASHSQTANVMGRRGYVALPYTNQDHPKETPSSHTVTSSSAHRKMLPSPTKHVSTASSAHRSGTTHSAVVSSASASATSSANIPSTSGTLSADLGASFGGCLDITAGIDVNVGANADFFGLFDVGKTVSLFSQQFELFKTCFGDQASSRGGLVRRASSRRLGRRTGLTCPVNLSSNSIAIVNQIVNAKGINAVEWWSRSNRP